MLTLRDTLYKDNDHLKESDLESWTVTQSQWADDMSRWTGQNAGKRLAELHKQVQNWGKRYRYVFLQISEA